jgi:hypothetical protein
MKESVYVFVEGQADKTFIRDYIVHIVSDFCFDKPDDRLVNVDGRFVKIVYTEGWSGIKGGVYQHVMQQNTGNGVVNLVIFDADDDFTARKADMEAWRERSGLSFEIFLFPNNRDCGALENLLENIILDKNRPIFECWDGYEDCLRNTTIVGRDEPLTTPAKKTKIYAYLEALLGKSKNEKKKIKEVERDYRNKDHWNLDADYLLPLQMFLTAHLLDRKD